MDREKTVRNETSDWLKDRSSVYFIGIGGVGMSALAKIVQSHGFSVSGSDRSSSDRTQELESLGIPVAVGQKGAGFQKNDLVVYSSAIREDHLELSEARRLGMRICHRAELLSHLFNRAATSIAVTGTHGKTTTSSMISFLLTELGRNPTCMVGGDVLNFGTNARSGDSDLWVSEVDESDQTHELYRPNYAVITNVEEDHLDHYPDLEAIKHSFGRFMDNARDPGLFFCSADDPVIREWLEAKRRPIVTFGLEHPATYRAQDIVEKDFGSEFDLWESDFFVSRVTLSVPGAHNIANALAALGLLIQMGEDPEELAPLITRFRGARRRLEVKWEADGFLVIDDYAHHPTELRAVLKTLKNRPGRLTAVFQPHRFSRTRHFYKDFSTVLSLADEVILTEIYGAGEANPEKVSASWIYDQLAMSAHTNVRMMEKNEIIPYLLNHTGLSGTVAFIGAGDIGEVADDFASRLKTFVRT